MTTHLNFSPKPRISFIQITKISNKQPSLLYSPISSSNQNPKISSISSYKLLRHLLKPFIYTNQSLKPLARESLNYNGNSDNNHYTQLGGRQMLFLCGFGYCIQGFRCFPWLALNFHMAKDLNLHPLTLQLVQCYANLPMVAKPLYGVLSDALYIGDAHRLPYLSFGVILQMLSWATMALIPVTDSFAAHASCILLGNLGASITEVSSDALIVEFGRKHGMGDLPSYAFMALAAGGILGNLSGGFFLQKNQQPRVMFLIFSVLLLLQLAASLTTKETFLYPPPSSGHHLVGKFISEKLSKQYSHIMATIKEDGISSALSWVVASVAVVPILSGTTFCYQTQCLKLDPSIIGMAKVIGQVMVLSVSVLYSLYLKKIPMRKLIFWSQITYAFFILSDWLLVKQVNIKLGISNEAHVLCLSALAEAVFQFKFLPFSVLFSNLSPPGCEGTLVALLASALCLSSVFSGILGVGLAYLAGISSDDFSNLPGVILLQVVAALLPLKWIPRTHLSYRQGEG